MNCRQVDKYLYDYCDNILDPGQRTQIEQHLIQCPSCRKIVDEAMLESSILREEWHTPALPDDFTARVMNQIAFAAIQDSSGMTQPGLKNHSKWARQLMYLAAMGAVLLIALCIPGMLKNPDLVQVADRERISPKVTNENITSSKSLTSEKYLKAPAGVQWSEEINDEALSGASFKKAQEESSPPGTRETENLSRNNSAAISQDASQQTPDMSLIMADTPVTPQAFPVQPVNLPASYVLLNKVDNAGSSTYIFGKGNKEEQLIINIAQLPLRQSSISTYSRGYIRGEEVPEAIKSSESQLVNDFSKPAGEQSQESFSVQSAEQSKEKADIAAIPATNTISYELEFKNQKFLLTLSGSLSPEELSILSRDLQLASTN